MAFVCCGAEYFNTTSLQHGDGMISKGGEGGVEHQQLTSKMEVGGAKGDRLAARPFGRPNQEIITGGFSLRLMACVFFNHFCSCPTMKYY